MEAAHATRPSAHLRPATCSLHPAVRDKGSLPLDRKRVCVALVGVWAWEPAARHARGSNGVLLHRRAHITCNQGNQAINQRHSARTASAACMPPNSNSRARQKKITKV
jgi:hypothetical protein